MKQQLLSVSIAALLLSGPVLADDWTVPRTPDGKPDLQGIWSNATQTPLERPEEFGDKRFLTEQEAIEREAMAQNRLVQADQPSDPERAPPVDGNTDAGYNTFWLDRGTNVATINGEYRTSLIIYPPNGRIPMVEGGGQQGLAAHWRRQPGVGPFDGPELRPLGERCLLSFSSSSGPPMLPVMYNNNYQIVQTPEYVMILVEMVHDARIIRIDDENLPEHMIKWMGDSVGRWEGDTLVVTTKNFHPQQSYRGASESLTVTERFTRVSEEQIVYNFTMDDPAVFTTSWTAEVPMRARPADDKMYEYACHEGNYALPGILAGARIQELDQ
jgi:hypothetical protein